MIKHTNFLNLILLNFLLLLCKMSYGQAPANDACSNAASLPCGTSNLAGTTVNAVSETAPSGCASAYGVWYTFTGNGQSTTISSATSGFDHEIDIFSGSCGSLTNIACIDASTGTESYTFNSVNGTTYYVYVAYYQTGTTTGAFTISRTCVAPPSNDACSNATSLPCGTSNLAGTTVNAVSETAPSGCASAYGVWYTFTGDGLPTTISSTTSGFDHEIDIFSGSCGSLTNIACIDASTGTESYTFNSVNGTTYYVYVAYYQTGTTTGAFTISRTCPPANDNCSGATSLPCGTSNLAGTTAGAVSETIPGGCASAYGVWYTFTGNGQSTTISSTAASGFDHEIDIFSGSCGSLSTIACTDVNGTGGTENYTFSSVSGTTYYVYVAYYTTGTTTGTFTISRTCTAPPANDDCAGAIGLTANSGTACTTSTGGTSAGATQSQAGCSGTADDDVWYSFTATSTSHSISVTPGTMSDAVFQIFSGSCGSLTTFSCINSTSGSTAESSVITGLTISSVYYVRIHSSGNGSGAGTFTVCVTTPPPPPGNDDCSNATSLPCGTSNLAGTTANAISETIPGGCASAYGVWYTFTGDGQSTTISSTAATGFDQEIDIFSGSCGSLTNITCTDAASSGGTENYTFSTVNGTTYYIYVAYYTTGTTTGTFTISRTCSAPIANDNCSGATSLPCGTSNLAGTTVGTTSETAPGSCASSYGVWYTFTGNGQYTTISSTAASGFDHEIDIFSGSCGSLTNIACTDGSGSGGTENYTFSAVNGTTYYVYVAYYTSGTTTGTFTISRTCTPPPANDECSGAYTVSVNSGTTCTLPQTGGTLIAATASSVTNICSGTADDDVWYSFVATATTHSISITNIAGSTTDLYHSVFAGSCGTLSAAFDCSDPNSSMVGGLTIGSTYYIRIFSYTSTTGQTTTFSVCVTTPTVATPPPNDNCSGAISVTPNSGTTCTSLSGGTLIGATSSTIANTCGGTADDDVWYSFVASSTTHSISLINIAGSTTDLYHSVYSGSCGSVGSPLVCSDPNTSALYGLTIGQTYYIRVFSWTSTYGQTSTFSVCVTTAPPTGACGNPTTNDYCSNPATLTQGAGNFSSTTSSLYTADQTQLNYGTFCGSIENNSWYSFVATSTSATFPFTSVSGCSMGYGVQAIVFSVSTSTNGCCNSFSSVSNCYNPGTTSLGTVTATGLTVGQSYILMIDGNSGDACSFTINGWTAVGILPLELLTFVGHNEQEKNKIQWVTATEKNTEYFTLEKSRDGVLFESVLNVTAAGYSTSPKNYNAFDMAPFEEVTYYRLKLVNFDNSFDYSNIIAIDNHNLTDYISNARPNPTNGNIEIDVNSKNKNKITIEIYDNTGNLISSEERVIEGGYRSLNIDLSKYPHGIYLLKTSLENSGKTEIQKIVKY